MNKYGQTICLNMIVKNEAHVIRRCLASVRPIIDHWIIVDTGSNDGTQDVIRKFLQDLPGELFERPWVNFAHNRTEALELARGKTDYLFTIDADETLEMDSRFEIPRLVVDAYNLEIAYGGCSYSRKQLVNNRLKWIYKSVLHEYIISDEAKTEEFLAGLRTVPRPDGARAQDPNTYRRDALLLENALLDEPDNTRYVFYLAQSYRDAGDLDQAIRNYRRRVEMAGWQDEVWYSLYQIAVIRDRKQDPWPEVMQDYLRAYELQPHRAGPLYRIGIHYQSRGEYQTAHLFFTRAMTINLPSLEHLFVERNIYELLLPLEYAVACFYVGDHEEAIRVNNQLLQSNTIPGQFVDQVIKNRRFSLDARHPKPIKTQRSPRLRVCVLLDSPSSTVDECIESLTQQDYGNFDVTIIDNGIGIQEQRLPVEHDRFSLIKTVSPIPLDMCIENFVREYCDLNDLVLPLREFDYLPGTEVLTQLAAAFDDPSCRLSYGQYREPTGHMGKSEPAVNAQDFNSRYTELCQLSPIAFAADLILSYQSSSSQTDSLYSQLFQRAGFEGTRFIDSILTFPSEAPDVTAAKNRQVLVYPTTVHSQLTSLPLISALMVTHDRLRLARRSIRSFAAQTYPNKELVIVSDGKKEYLDSLRRYVDEIRLKSVIFIDVEGDNTLGKLRNVSLDSASGQVVCQWDDDDCNHPERMMIQFRHMLENNARACLLTDHLQYLEAERKLVWVDWTLGGREGRDQLLPGTIMLFLDDHFRYPEEGEYARQGEDTVFLYKICDQAPVTPLVGKGYLYLYTYHGRNTFDAEHHYRLSQFSRTAMEMMQLKELICDAVINYPLARPLVIAGRDSSAFTLNH